MVPLQPERTERMERIFAEVAVRMFVADRRTPTGTHGLRAPCAYCTQPLMLREATLDHIVPRARGGRNMRTNLAIACYPCNLRKGDTPPDAWRAWIGTREGRAWLAIPWRERLRETGTPDWLRFVLRA
jgi:hypothetical protein